LWNNSLSKAYCLKAEVLGIAETAPEGNQLTMEPVFINLDKGIIELFNLNYKEALVLFDRQIASTPESHEAYLYRGHTKYILNDIAGACIDWRKALSLGNRNAAMFTGRFCH
jgi:tetratricopeptide (TPR) repeat protein